MDVIEANLIRCRFFLANKMEDCFKGTEVLAYYFLNVAIHNLEYEIIEERLTQLQKMYRQIIWNIVFSRQYGPQGKIKRGLFCINKKAFAVICKKEKI